MRIAFVGGGVMAEAIIKGVLTRKLAEPGQISVGEPVESRRKSLIEKHRILTTANNHEAIVGAQAVVLAVKPQNLRDALTSLKGAIGSDQTIVSIVAGARLATLTEGLGHQAVVRVMPNTPGQIGAGVSAWTASNGVTEDGRHMARAIVQTLGIDVYVDDEKYIEMATALSASGPAYVFMFLEALIEAGVYLGMNRDMARTLALHTVLGSAKLMQESGESPAHLREMVSSPGGTTVEALLTLEEGAFRATVINAVAAAYEKSLQLGEKS
jgi:pyrroline-5-carboxylate reductase